MNHSIIWKTEKFAHYLIHHKEYGNQNPAPHRRFLFYEMNLN